MNTYVPQWCRAQAEAQQLREKAADDVQPSYAPASLRISEDASRGDLVRLSETARAYA
jgi:hypothetical protein